MSEQWQLHARNNFVAGEYRSRQCTYEHPFGPKVGGETNGGNGSRGVLEFEAVTGPVVRTEWKVDAVWHSPEGKQKQP